MEVKYAFVIDTKSSCFLCLKEIDKDGESECAKLFSLKMLSRYLKINPKKIPGAMALAGLDDIRSEQLVSTCSTCFQVLDKFRKCYEELELAKMRIYASLHKIQEMMKETQMNEDGVQLFREIMRPKVPGESSHLEFVLSFRHEISSRSTGKLKQMQPKVRIVKLDTHGKTNDLIDLNPDLEEDEEFPVYPFVEVELTEGENSSTLSLEPSESSENGIVLPCPHCNGCFLSNYLGNHIDNVHFEERFISFKLKSLSRKQFRLATQRYLKAVQSANESIGGSVQCLYCSQLLEGVQLHDTLNVHLINQHFSLVSQKILSFQKQFDVKKSPVVFETENTIASEILKLDSDSDEDSRLSQEPTESQEIFFGDTTAGSNSKQAPPFLFLCHYCDVRFCYKRSLDRHVDDFHFEERFISLKLPSLSKEQFKLATQQFLVNIEKAASNDSDKTLRCPHCPQVYDGTEPMRPLRLHLLSHHFILVSKMILPFQKQFIDQSEPSKNMSTPLLESFIDIGETTSHGKKIYLCRICSQRITNIDLHIRAHRNDRLRCAYCSMTFIQSLKLDLHVSTSHCDVLFARFNIASLAKDELNSVIDLAFEEILHFKRNPLKKNRCPQCPQYHVYRKNSNEQFWRRHMTDLHIELVGQKIYDLQKKMYPARVPVSVEPVVSNLKKPYKCACGRSFSEAGTLRRHRRTVCPVPSKNQPQPSPKYRCECGIYFNHSSSLTRHQKTICKLGVNGTSSTVLPDTQQNFTPSSTTSSSKSSSSVRYRCECGIRFAHSSSLWRHKKKSFCRVHSIKESVVTETGETVTTGISTSPLDVTSLPPPPNLPSLIPLQTINYPPVDQNETLNLNEEPFSVLPDIDMNIEHVDVEPKVEVRRSYDFVNENDDNLEEMYFPEQSQDHGDGEEEAILGDPLSFM